MLDNASFTSVRLKHLKQMSDIRVIKTTTNYVLNLFRNFFLFCCCCCYFLFFCLFFGYILQSFMTAYHARKFRSLWECYSRWPISPSHHITTKLREVAQTLHSQKVQFVQLLTAYLGIVIRFVNFPSSSVDRKAQFVAGWIIRRVCTLRCNWANRSHWFHINLKIIVSACCSPWAPTPYSPCFIKSAIVWSPIAIIDRTCSHSRVLYQAFVCYTYRLTCHCFQKQRNKRKLLFSQVYSVFELIDWIPI